MDDFTPGQRWVSDNDAALGLGIVKSVAFRTVPFASRCRISTAPNPPFAIPAGTAQRPELRAAVHVALLLVALALPFAFIHTPYRTASARCLSVIHPQPSCRQSEPCASQRA